MQRQKEIKAPRTNWTTDAQEGALFALAHKKAQEARELLEAAGCSCQAVLNWTLEHDVVCTKCKKQVKHLIEKEWPCLL